MAGGLHITTHYGNPGYFFLRDETKIYRHKGKGQFYVKKALMVTNKDKWFSLGHVLPALPPHPHTYPLSVDPAAAPAERVENLFPPPAPNRYQHGKEIADEPYSAHQHPTVGKV